MAAPTFPRRYTMLKSEIILEDDLKGRAPDRKFKAKWSKSEKVDRVGNNYRLLVRVRNLQDVDDIISSILVFDYDFLQSHPILFESYAHIYHNDKEEIIRPIASWIPPQHLPPTLRNKFSSPQHVQLTTGPEVFFEEDDNAQVDVDEIDIQDLLKSPAHFFPQERFEDVYEVFPPGVIPPSSFEIDPKKSSHRNKTQSSSSKKAVAEAIDDDEKLLNRYNKPSSKKPVNVCASCIGLGKK